MSSGCAGSDIAGAHLIAEDFRQLDLADPKRVVAREKVVIEHFNLELRPSRRLERRRKVVDLVPLRVERLRNHLQDAISAT